MAEMTLQKLTPEYFEFVRNLRNDDDIKQGFINQEMITKEDHAVYMKINAKYYWIAFLHNEPAGYVGVVENDIRIAVSQDFSRLGIAEFMVLEIRKLFPSAVAKVKYHNLASKSLFEKCGFQPSFIIYQ
jgi:L-amino acid N-acyltransferase YncA